MRDLLEGAPLELVDLTIPGAVDSSPGELAAVDGSQQLTYPELRERSVVAARGLVELGVRPGDRVGLIMTNRLEFLIVFVAACRAGAIVIPLNTRLTPPELELQLAHSGASLVIAEEEFRDRRFRDEIAGVQPQLPGLHDVVSVDALAKIEQLGGAQPLPRLSCDDPTLLIYTSGTTGTPKGCLHAHRSFVNNALMCTQVKRMTASDRLLATIPFCTVGGILNTLLEAFLVGATVVLQPTFDPDQALALIERERVTIMGGAPTMFIRLEEHRRFETTDLSSLRSGGIGGAPCPPELVSRWRERMEIVTIYGLSEAPTILVNDRPSAGLAVAVSTKGELTARGYNQMLGYFRDPERTAERIRDGWLRTGDLASLTDDGTVAVSGRADDMVIVGAFNVQPVEVEDVLREHPALADACVFGVPDRDLGEALAAWVIPRPRATVDSDELRAFCRQQLAAFKVPGVFKVVDEFPLTASGKVQRFQLRAAMAAEKASR